LRAAVHHHRPVDHWNTVRGPDVPLVANVAEPHRLGIDRLLGAYAAAQRFPRQLVLVDVGSAVTVDWVRREDGDSGRAVFCGGAIFPGIALQLGALARGTEALARGTDSVEQPLRRSESPFAQFDQASFSNLQVPAKQTEAAIRLGVLACLAGGVERLAEEYRLRSGQSGSPTLVLTGGDGRLVTNFLKVDHVFSANLVCRGLLDLAIHHDESEAGKLE